MIDLALVLPFLQLLLIISIESFASMSAPCTMNSKNRTPDTPGSMNNENGVIRKFIGARSKRLPIIA